MVAGPAARSVNVLTTEVDISDDEASKPKIVQADPRIGAPRSVTSAAQRQNKVTPK